VVASARELLTDAGVLVSVVAALAVVLAAGVARLKVPAVLVWLPPVVVAAEIAAVDGDHYLRLTVAGYQWWTGPVMALALAAFVVAARSLPAHPASASTLSVFMAAATAGVFLCVPETMLLRLLPGPVIIAAAAVVVGKVRPVGFAGALALAAALSWITIVDGQSRGSAVIGGGACLAAAWLMPIALRKRPEPLGTGPLGRRAFVPAVLVAAVLACSRLAAGIDSAIGALVAIVAVLAVAAAVLWLQPPVAVPARSTE
jgi:hypothetical protein